MIKNSQKIILVASAIIAMVGIIDASFLTFKHYSGGAVICTVVEGCSLVLNSPWATFLDVPTAAYGIGYYGLLLFLLLAYIGWRDLIVLKAALVVSMLGLLVTLWFLYLQVFVIAAVCEYCLVSAACTFAIWANLFWLLSRRW